MSHPIDVCLSIDVEPSLNVALMRPERRPLGLDWVFGPADGESHGLGFLLDCLDRHALQGTFFTEVFNVHHFGDGPTAELIGAMQARGQDVQMHLHPVWLYYRFADWRARLPAERPMDHFSGHPEDQVTDWLRDGTAIFERLSGRPPLAFRSGNLDADHGLYRALTRAGIRLSSNIGVGLRPPQEPALRLHGGVHRIEGVTEVPVTSYRPDLLRRPLLLATLAGSAFAELRGLLTRAAHRGIGPVVLLLHPHDLRIAVPDTTGNRPRYLPDRTRQRRLERLCGFLAAHPDRFRVVTFAEAAARWQTAADSGNPLLTSPLLGLAQRLAENRLLPALRRVP